MPATPPGKVEISAMLRSNQRRGLSTCDADSTCGIPPTWGRIVSAGAPDSVVFGAPRTLSIGWWAFGGLAGPSASSLVWTAAGGGGRSEGVVREGGVRDRPGGGGAPTTGLCGVAWTRGTWCWAMKFACLFSLPCSFTQRPQPRTESSDTDSGIGARDVGGPHTQSETQGIVQQALSRSVDRAESRHSRTPLSIRDETRVLKKFSVLLPTMMGMFNREHTRNVRLK